MDKTQAIAFLKSHQPLPPESELTEELINTFDEIREYFTAHPDPVCIPLFLNAFGDGTGFGVYELCDDVLNKYDGHELVPHLAAALQSQEPSVRWWAAHWSMEFPNAALVGPLVELLARPEDEDAHYFALAALGFVLDQTPNPQIVGLLRERQVAETDAERSELIQQILEEHG